MRHGHVLDGAHDGRWMSTRLSGDGVQDPGGAVQVPAAHMAAEDVTTASIGVQLGGLRGGARLPARRGHTQQAAVRHRELITVLLLGVPVSSELVDELSDINLMQGLLGS